MKTQWVFAMGVSGVLLFASGFAMLVAAVDEGKKAPKCPPVECPKVEVVRIETLMQKRVDQVLPGARVLDVSANEAYPSIELSVDRLEFRVGEIFSGGYYGSIPGGATPTDLRRLADLVEKFEAAKLLEDLP